MSFKVEVLGVGEKTFVSNGVRFATAAEAEASGFELSCRWFGMSEYRVAESEDPVNYRFVDGRNQRLEVGEITNVQNESFDPGLKLHTLDLNRVMERLADG